MTVTKTTTATEGCDLVLTRIIDASREKGFEVWTRPELVKEWFAHAPCTTPVVERTNVLPAPV
ncbi:MAG TPA: hypothetical protein VKS22_17080 [Candidatus Binataceae bacterium]|nr:hypothetical protein [Candidatus Binataceae bacterium]